MMQTNPAAASFSQSSLWRMQRYFYEHQGIEAWRQTIVPTYITSNPALASAYAKIVFGFLRDWQRNITDDTTEKGSGDEDAPLFDSTRPIYLLELGAGSGRFSYLFLKKFLPLLQSSVLKNLTIKYVMTDISYKLIEYWQGHTRLQPLIAQGVLDFAFFDAEQPAKIELVIAGGSLDQQLAEGPVIVLANYFFDSIPQDLFEVKNGRLSEKLVSLAANNSNDESELERLNASRSDKLELVYHSRPVSTNFYSDPSWNKLLEYYRETLNYTNFLFPTVALNCIKYFQQLTNQQVFLLSADKGFIEAEELLQQAEPEIVFHGSISLMVNYHAIGQYVVNQGGQYLRPERNQKLLNICAFLPASAPSPEQSGWYETNLAYREAIDNYNPIDFYHLKKGLEQVYEHLSLEQLLSFLRLSSWDSNIFMSCMPVLLKQISQASPSLKEELLEAAAKIWDNYYPLGEAKDVAFDLGILLFGLQQYKMALEYFEHSLKIYGPDAGVIYNMGMCYRNLGQTKKAQAYLAKAKMLDPSLGH